MKKKGRHIPRVTKQVKKHQSVQRSIAHKSIQKKRSQHSKGQHTRDARHEYEELYYHEMRVLSPLAVALQGGRIKKEPKKTIA